MNFMMIQDRIVNLDNMTVARCYNPGDRDGLYPLDESRIKKYELRLELNVPAGSDEGFDSKYLRFEYDSKQTRDRDWKQLCRLVKLP